MKSESRTTGLGRGLIVGLCATQALDWVSVWLYEGEAASTRRAEDSVRGHRHAYEVAVERLAIRIGAQPSRAELARVSFAFHKVFGILGGLAYLRLRRRWPALRWGCGLAFGSAFFLLGDELMVPALKLTPGPLAFSWKVHARGALAHLAYGVAAEATARLIESRPAAAEPSRPTIKVRAADATSSPLST